MSRHRLEVYLDKVFDFSQRRAALPEGRKYPRIPWSTIFDAVFLGAACQFPSLHQLEAECGTGVLRTRIGPLSEDAIGYALERQSAAPLLDLHCEVARQLKRNGVLHSSWARGLVVVAVDGIEICSSFVRCCPGCLERTVHHKVGEELREERYRAAESLYAIVVPALRRTRGVEDPITLACQGNYAWALISDGKYPAAESLALQVLALRRKVLGGQNKETMDSANNLAVLYVHTGRLDLADAELACPSNPERLLLLDDALGRLTQEDPAAAQVAQLRLFAGLPVEEAAQALGISRATAFRHWTYARAWLQAELAENQDAE